MGCLGGPLAAIGRLVDALYACVWAFVSVPPAMRETGDGPVEVVKSTTDRKKYAILYFHGTACAATVPPWHAEAEARDAVVYAAAPFAALRGGWPSERKVLAAAVEAYERVQSDGFQPDRIFIWGHSLGCWPAVKLPGELGKFFAGVVVQSPVASACSAAASWAGLIVWCLGLDTFKLVRPLGSMYRANVAHVDMPWGIDEELRKDVRTQSFRTCEMLHEEIEPSILDQLLLWNYLYSMPLSFISPRPDVARKVVAFLQAQDETPAAAAQQ